MNEKKPWARTLYIMGAVGIVVGALDPLEGSVVVVISSVLMALSTLITNDRHRNIFLLSLLLILFGVGFMFYFSTLGGFGQDHLSWWWGLLVLPYPAGWLLAIVYIVRRLLKSKNEKEPAEAPI